MVQLQKYNLESPILIISLIFCLTTSLFCQNFIKGNVTDGSTVIPFARITLFNNDLTFFQETRTDNDGNFTLTDIPNGNYMLGATALKKEYIELLQNLTGDVNDLKITLADEIHSGKWKTIMNSPEPLGGTDFGILLPNGMTYYCHSSKHPFLFDPTKNDTLFAPGDKSIQGCIAPGLMLDGKLIFVGGTDREIYGPGTQLVKTFNPTTKIWKPQIPMIDYRWYPTMTQLSDGQLLIVGGGGKDNPVRVKTSEIYDPYKMTVEQVGDIEIGNEVSPIVLLYTGKVLMTHRPPQLYDPTTKEWNLAADFVQGNRLPNGDHSDHELVLLPDGRAIAVGYKSFDPPNYGQFIEIYDPKTDNWSTGRNFLPIRSRAKTVLLPNKKILVIGGEKEDPNDSTPTNNWNQIKLTDLYDPYDDSWRRLDELQYAREYHCTTILVPDGRVVAVGGEGSPGNEPKLSVIEAFEPPYLFKGIRPEIANLNRNDFRRGEAIEFDIFKTNAPTSVILMSLQSVTHFMNTGNNRYLELNFTQRENHISAIVPKDSLAALPGYYMLIAMVDDIPSVAKIVKVEKETIVTGIKDILNKSDKITFYPNPASTFITIKTGRNIFIKKEIILVNILGQSIGNYFIENELNELAISHLNTGVYFLIVELETGEKIIEKIIIE